ncbi:metallophosphoesterase [Candidatus Lokiarchaeum ossiferum]|uniref:metallophosphoesterase n=1 Tax=Candidatus Lokiarchaeum ossiferum TaxID=2951803 RepID=UPI00352D9582
MDKILIISDFHFTQEINSTRDAILNDYISFLTKFPDELQPEIIIIAGDIAQSAKWFEYRRALKFCKNLFEKLNILPENIVICPGNHDIKQNQFKIFYPPNDIRNVGDILLKPENIKHYQAEFRNFSRFCRELRIKKKSITLTMKSHLVGYQEIGRHKFFVFNSAWFSRSTQHDSKRMQIGSILHQKQKECCNDIDSLYNWTIFHHNLIDLYDQDETYFKYNIRKHVDFYITAHRHKVKDHFADFYYGDDSYHEIFSGAMFLNRKTPIELNGQLSSLYILVEDNKVAYKTIIFEKGEWNFRGHNPSDEIFDRKYFDFKDIRNSKTSRSKHPMIGGW